MSRNPDLGCSLQCEATSSCSNCQELGHVEEEIVKGEEIVRQAKTRRSVLLSQANTRRDALTSKLPIEIVCYIFEEYVKTFDMKPKDSNSNTDLGRPFYFSPIHRSGPLNLGAVCRKWRNLAWSHSRLWKTLVISVSCPGHDMGPGMVSEWLKRTGEQLLDICMTGYIYPELPRTRKDAMLIIQEINRVSSRWHSLDLAESPLYILHQLDDTGCTSQSVLKNLCIGFNPRVRNLEGLTLLQKSKHKHQPTHLSLLGPVQPSRFNIEWMGLTHLYLEQTSRKHCFRILNYTPKSSPALRHLSLRLKVDNLELNFEVETLNLLHVALETLVIHEEDCDPGTTTWLLNSLTLPALRMFKYDGDMNDGENGIPTDEFSSLLRRSACSLETLELLSPWVGSDDDLARMLRAIPSLRTFKLELKEDNINIDVEELFICLAQKDLKNQHATPFLPNLARLDITAYPPQHWSAFIGMFADDPMIHTPDFGKTVPTRHALQVTFRVYPDDVASDFMDLMSLSQLAVLWKTHQFFAAVQFVDGSITSRNKVSFLLESYRVGTIGLPRPALEKYTKLEQYLTTMSTLTF